MASIKRSKWQRQNKPLPAAPPPPEATTALVAAGEDINRGNSNLQPLSQRGVEKARDDGQKLAEKGGLDSLKTSGSVRGDQTAQEIANASPTPLPVQHDGDMQSWSQGNLEGQPMASVKDQISDLIRNNPAQKIPGKGALSTRPGESFDDFRTSRLSAIRGHMQELANDPTSKRGIVTHSQVIKLTRGWLANGTPDDLSIKPESMEDKREPPGSVVRLFPNKDGEWEMTDVDLNNKEPLTPGIYMIRHGPTPWNKETYQGGDSTGGPGLDHLDARREIAKHTKAMNWKGVQEAATRAQQTGQLSDDEISSAIDSSLPSGDKAANLPYHRLLAVAAAASPEKQKEYAKPLTPFLSGVNQLPLDARAQMTAHLNKIGLGQQQEAPSS